MATYAPGPQYPGVIYLGGTQTQEVMFCGMTANPGTDNIYFEFSIDRPAYSLATYKATAQGFADVFETILAVPGVAGMEWVQTPKGGNLLSSMVISVQSTSGNSSNEVTVPLGSLSPELVAPIVAPLVKTLNEIEAL